MDNNEEGQLFLLSAVFMAITLVILVSLSSTLANIGTFTTREQTHHLSIDYEDIRVKFGVIFNQQIDQKGNPTRNNVNESFDETTHTLSALLAIRGLEFSAIQVNDSIDPGTGFVIGTDASLLLTDYRTTISEIIYYRVI